MIQKFHESKNLFDLASWIIANGSTYTKDGESYTFDTKQSMFSTPFYFSNTDIDVSISGIIESITAPNPRLHLLHANGTTAKSGALTPSTLKSENISCAGLKLDWSSTGGTVKISNLMLNSGSTALPYEPYGDTWQGKAYSKIVDTTQQVTSFPVVVRPMENAIPSWTIKGNLVQDGTPSPSNPIYPSECGDRTENLFDMSFYDGKTGITVLDNKATGTCSSFFVAKINMPSELVGKTLTWSAYIKRTGSTSWVHLQTVDEGSYEIGTNVTGEGISTITFTATATKQLYINYNGTGTDGLEVSNIMLVEGSTALPYQPYGYKLDIKSGNTTTPVYLGEVESTRRIKKLVLTGNETPTTAASITSTNAYQFRNDITDYEREAFICSHMPVSNSSSGSGTHGYIGTYLTLCFDKAMGLDTTDKVQAYLAQQYAAGTPVCVWYVLATPTTGVVNEPLRKIGTYSDSVSGTNLSVTAQSPTTIDVDTSLKPSEMDLTYTGKKMCKRKKRVNGAWV